MIQGDLFACITYREGYEPGVPTCADCIRLNPAWAGWKVPSRCTLLRREVDRVTGRCDDFEGTT